MNIESKFKYLSTQFSQNASVYFETGFNLIKHSSFLKNHAQIQVSIGNISIAIELIIKSFLADISPNILFKNMPDDIRLYLLNSKRPPSEFNAKDYRNIQLINYTGFETIDFSRCVSLFSIYKPKFHKEFRNYFKDLVGIRNECIHSSFHEFNRIHYERFTYLCINIFKEINMDIKSTYIRKILEEKEVKTFCIIYKEAIAQKLQDKINKARSKKVEKIKTPIEINDVFSEYVYQCPICENDIIIHGTTSANYKGDEDNNPVDVDLIFEPEYFKCEHCGLEVEDYEEMLLLDMDDAYDMSGLNDEWMREKVLGY